MQPIHLIVRCWHIAKLLVGQHIAQHWFNFYMVIVRRYTESYEIKVRSIITLVAPDSRILLFLQTQCRLDVQLVVHRTACFRLSGKIGNAMSCICKFVAYIVNSPKFDTIRELHRSILMRPRNMFQQCIFGICASTVGSTYTTHFFLRDWMKAFLMSLVTGSQICDFMMQVTKLQAYFDAVWAKFCSNRLFSSCSPCTDILDSSYFDRQSPLSTCPPIESS